MNVEPYMILTDRALRGLASIRPKSLAEAEGVPAWEPWPRQMELNLDAKLK